MTPVTHQTVKLSKGRHDSPDEGACVMELASMLAGEPFSDHPASVCPVIGSCLRAYNDWIDDDRRQDLYRYAAKVVGMLWPQPDDLGSRMVQAVARRRRGSHREVLDLIDELLSIRAQRRAPASTPPTMSAIVVPSRAPASTSPG